MREQVEQRVSELRAELQKGQHALAELESRQAELRQTLLRISGAIQVLEELLSPPAPPPRTTPASSTAPASTTAPAPTTTVPRTTPAAAATPLADDTPADGLLLRANGDPTPANAS